MAAAKASSLAMRPGARGARAWVAAHLSQQAAACAAGGCVAELRMCAGPPSGGNDGGDAAGQGFEDYVAEGIGVGGEDEEVHVGVGRGEGFAAEDAGEFGVGERGAEVGFFGSVADDEPVRDDAQRAELGVDFGEEGYVFFYRQAAYVTQNHVGVVEGAVAASGGEERGVHAALHEVAGAVDGALEEGAEGGVGGIERLGAAVELRGEVEGGGFDGALYFFAYGAEVAREPAHAAGGVLVKIGVPAGDEWDVELVGEVGSKETELAGAGDVDDVGAEGADGGGDEIGVAEEEWVEA